MLLHTLFAVFLLLDYIFSSWLTLAGHIDALLSSSSDWLMVFHFTYKESSASFIPHCTEIVGSAGLILEAEQACTHWHVVGA